MPMFSRLAILLLISACSAAPAVSPKPLSGAALRWCVLNPDRVLDAYDSSGAPTIRGNGLQALYLMVTNLTDDAEMLGSSPPNELASMEPLSAEQVAAVRAACRTTYEDAAPPDE
jgi:hypothetical protein